MSECPLFCLMAQPAVQRVSRNVTEHFRSSHHPRGQRGLGVGMPGTVLPSPPAYSRTGFSFLSDRALS